MTYRVYSGPRGSESISPAEKDRHLYKEFSVLDEAMMWARHVNKRGRVALLIEGDDGTRLDFHVIAWEISNGSRPGQRPFQSAGRHRGSSTIARGQDIARELSRPAGRRRSPPLAGEHGLVSPLHPSRDARGNGAFGGAIEAALAQYAIRPDNRPRGPPMLRSWFFLIQEAVIRGSVFWTGPFVPNARPSSACSRPGTKRRTWCWMCRKPSAATTRSRTACCISPIPMPTRCGPDSTSISRRKSGNNPPPEPSSSNGGCPTASYSERGRSPSAIASKSRCGSRTARRSLARADRAELRDAQRRTEFAAQTNSNKVFEPPYAACKSDRGNRWVITAFEPCHR